MLDHGYFCKVANVPYPRELCQNLSHIWYAVVGIQALADGRYWFWGELERSCSKGWSPGKYKFSTKTKVSYFIGSFLKPNKPQPTEMYHKAIHLLLQYKDVNL